MNLCPSCKKNLNTWVNMRDTENIYRASCFNAGCPLADEAVTGKGKTTEGAANDYLQQCNETKEFGV